MRLPRVVAALLFSLFAFGGPGEARAEASISIVDSTTLVVTLRDPSGVELQEVVSGPLPLSRVIDRMLPDCVTSSAVSLSNFDGSIAVQVSGFLLALSLSPGSCTLSWEVIGPVMQLTVPALGLPVVPVLFSLHADAFTAASGERQTVHLSGTENESVIAPGRFLLSRQKAQLELLSSSSFGSRASFIELFLPGDVLELKSTEFSGAYDVNPGQSINIDQTTLYSAVVPSGAFAAPAVGSFGRFALAGILLAAGLVGLGLRRRRAIE